MSIARGTSGVGGRERRSEAHRAEDAAMSRPWLCLAFSALAMAVATAMIAAPADAALTHQLRPAVSATITEGVPAASGAARTGPLSGVDALTVDAGGVWLAENLEGRGLSRIDLFDAASGAFKAQLQQTALLERAREGVAVGHATGEREVYVGAAAPGVEGGVVGVFGPSGSLQATWTGSDTPGGSFGASGGGSVANVTSVAVDAGSALADWAAGDVYVSTDSGAGGVVDVFKPEAKGKEKYVTQIPGTEPEPGVTVPFTGPEHVTVDAQNGDVLVEDGGHVIDVFAPVSGVEGSFRFVFQITGTPAGAFERVQSIAVDGAEGDIYVVENETVVDEFKLAPSGEAASLEGRLSRTSAGPFSLVRSVAVDAATHDLYVGDYMSEAQTGAVDAFGPDLVIPDVRADEPSELTPTSVRLNGSVDPKNAGNATCRFVWGTTKALDQSAGCVGGSVPNGEGAMPVHAAIGELQPDTTYYYRLQATNANGTNAGEAVEDRAFVTLGPGIREQSVADVATTSATLGASIDPHNSPATYYFEYGTGPGYGLSSPVPPGAPLGSGGAPLQVAQQLQGLTAGVLYHYRVVVVSEPEAGVFATFKGKDSTFTTQAAGGAVLPDGRAWEMVSPPEKHGALIESIGEQGEQGVIQAAADGHAITYLADAPTETTPKGYANLQQVLSLRTASAWSSHDIAIPHLVQTGAGPGVGQEYRYFTEDLSSGIVQPLGAFIPASSPQALSPHEASEQTPFERTVLAQGAAGQTCEAECFRPLVTDAAGFANVPPGTVFGETNDIGKPCPPIQLCGPQFIDATPDLEHVVMASRVALTSVPTPEGDGLYEWSAGTLTLLSQLPESEGGLPATGAVLGDNSEDTRGAISHDGSRVFWSTHVGVTHLYVRDLAKAETLRLDVGGSNSEASSPEFQFASNDGSRVFFTDRQHLTSDSGGTESSRDLYECALVEVGGVLKCQLTDLTPIAGKERAGVQGTVVGGSADASALYFVANGALGTGAPHGSCNGGASAPGATCNLFLREGSTTKLVATLSGEDFPDWNSDGSQPELNKMTSRVSSGGRWLAFMSQRGLAGNDTRDAVSGKLDEQVYLYDAVAGKVICASCDPTGAQPLGVEYEQLEGGPVAGQKVWPGTTWLAANIPGWTPFRGAEARHQARYLSNSGRLLFNSRDALVSQDANGTEDVYQYEPPGVGDCTTAIPTYSARSGGCVGLISSGSATDESGLLDASETGGDVFFLTTAKLSSADFDQSFDIYDAHECSAASPCLPVLATPPLPCDSGDSCKAPATPQPNLFGAPATTTLSGVGNLAGQPTSKPPSLTRAQKLRRALKACKAKKRKGKRRACERGARKRYAAKRSAGANAKKRGHR